MPDKQDLQKELRKAQAECQRLQEENTRLKALLQASATEPAMLSKSQDKESTSITSESPTDDKISLFRSLFRGREDVYAVRWESKNGRSGYSPACPHEWDRKLCGKPKVKCASCKNRTFLPVRDNVIRDHLIGKQTIGIYPLLSDETCWFLAADFDKSTWHDDTEAFLETCERMGIPAGLERSRSGGGAHIWIFFEQSVPASQARRLGCTLLTRTMERRHQIGLDSYDRLFPSQNTIPKGGFGSLIALPLQHSPRKAGNSIFLNREFEPYSDQWAFLSKMKRLSLDEVDAIVKEAMGKVLIIGVQRSLTDDETSQDPWTLPPSEKKPIKFLKGPVPETIQIVLGNLIYIEKKGLPSTLLNHLIRLAAFQNPEFYKAQAMRLPTFGKPRVISCAEEYPQHLGLPRGCLRELLEFLEVHHIKPDISDELYDGVSINVTFHGELRPLQEEAANALLANNHGILSASTAFGKTIVALWLIAARKVNTLIMVHRRQLMDQWRERISSFLGLPLKEIGLIGGGNKRPTRFIDVGLIQSLNRKGEVTDLVADYGQVIVDECHHVSAFSFEQVLKKVKARFVVGLTATPTRKDGHHPIIMMQCGPVRFRVNPKDQAAKRAFKHIVLTRPTELKLPAVTSVAENGSLHHAQLGIQSIYAALAFVRHRNDMILDDLMNALETGRSPLILTERTDHLELLAERLKGFARNVIVMRGGMGKRQREALQNRMEAIPDTEERVLLSTGRYIGEGFDDARLDTLFLAMPISWRGTLQQYAGRLHRHHDSKREVQIYDYVDIHVPVLVRMYEKRVKGYQAIGYSVTR